MQARHQLVLTGTCGTLNSDDSKMPVWWNLSLIDGGLNQHVNTLSCSNKLHRSAME